MLPNYGASKRPQKRLVPEDENSTANNTPNKRHCDSVQTWLDSIEEPLESIEEPLQQENLQEKELLDEPTVESLELFDSPVISVATSDPFNDQISQLDSQSTASDRLDPIDPTYWATLRANGIVLDWAGDKIPAGVQELIEAHIKKRNKRPELSTAGIAEIQNTLEEYWHNAEKMLSAQMWSSLFKSKHPDLIQGGETPWTETPLPTKPTAPYRINIPKPDLLTGFRSRNQSSWSPSQLYVVNHAFIRDYALPTSDSIMPFWIVEFESEATKGTLYEAEGKAAGAGAHRVASLHYLRTLADPTSYKPTSADSIAFSTVVTQREAVLYVHFYDPAEDVFYMSFVDSFYFAKKGDVQSFCNHHANVVEWMVEIQQPIVRALLDELYPMTLQWKKG